MGPQNKKKDNAILTSPSSVRGHGIHLLIPRWTDPGNHAIEVANVCACDVDVAAVSPDHSVLAKREGWIWVRDPNVDPI